MAKIVSFRAEYGATMEIRGTYHKLYCAIEVQPEENEDTEVVKERAWNTVFNEVEKQIREL
jgi:hypothetical protein